MTPSVLQSEDELRAQIPDNYRLAGPKHVETAAGTDEPVISKERLHAPIPIWIIQGEGIRLRARKPVMVRVTTNGDYCFAGNDALAVYGTGFTAAEAIADLYTHICHFYRYYRGLQSDRVTGEGARLKRLFSQVFVEE